MDLNIKYILQTWTIQANIETENIKNIEILKKKNRTINS